MVWFGKQAWPSALINYGEFCPAFKDDRTETWIWLSQQSPNPNDSSVGIFLFKDFRTPAPSPPFKMEQKSNSLECIVTYTKMEQKYSSARNLNFVAHALYTGARKPVESLTQFQEKSI